MRNHGTNEAAHTATHLLTSIEANTRKTFLAGVAALVLLFVIALMTCYLGVEYMRVKSAVQSMQSEVQKIPLPTFPSGD